jgi:hypothetical protein
MDEKRESRFTEEERKLVEYLPENERRDFEGQLANLMMQRQINNTRWDEEISRIEEEADKLFIEIKEHLKKIGKEEGRT